MKWENHVRGVVWIEFLKTLAKTLSLSKFKSNK